MIGAYIQIIIALAGVVGLIFLLGFFIRKKQDKAGLMNVLAHQSFGPKKGVAAVKIGKEVLLLGITSTDIKLLKTFAENELDTGIAGNTNDKLNRLRNIRECLNEHK